MSIGPSAVRLVVSGILHILKSGYRWCNCPPEYGLPATIYNRFVRRAERSVLEKLLHELATAKRAPQTQIIDSTHVKAHRSAYCAKGGRPVRLSAARVEGATRKFMQTRMLKAVFFLSR